MNTDKRLWRNRKAKKELARRLQSENPGLEVVHPRAAGIDLGNGAHSSTGNGRRTPSTFIASTLAQENPGPLRIRVADKHAEVITGLKNIRRVDDSTLGPWAGVTPDGSLLFPRDIGSQEIYALQVKWP